MKVVLVTQLRRRIGNRRLLLSAIWLMLLVVASAANAHAQDAQDAPETAPPPMMFVSRAERDQLAAARDAKARTRISLDLAESHLRRAGEFSSARQYDEAANEFGNYQGIIEDALRFLKNTRSDSGKTRDFYRKIELTLRAHGPRIEMIRRTTPYEYAVHVKELAKFIREARSRALDAFYGDTVLREDQSTGTPAPSANPHSNP